MKCRKELIKKYCENLIRNGYKILFLVNGYHQVVFAVSWMVITHYPVISSITKYHGLQLQESANEINGTALHRIGEMTERVLFCGLGVYDRHNSFEYIIYVYKSRVLNLQAVGISILVGNIIESLLYEKIFGYMKR